MRFVKNKVNTTPIEDNVFAVVKLAKAAKEKYGEDQVIDATIGSLYNENGTIVAMDSVFTPYKQIKNETMAAYAASFTGNESFRNQVYQWVIQPGGCTLAHSVIATPGGTGAVNMTIESVLDEGETLVLPDIAWGSYQLMAGMLNLKTVTYDLFEDDHFNLTSFKETCQKVMDQQQKLLVVINDPCHNPTGYSLTIDEWEEIVQFFNACGKQGPVILLNDIAYIDYAYDLDHCHDYMQTFNQFSDHVMAVVAFSCSKTLTSYGLRCGAAIILGQNAEDVRNMEIVFEKTARATWSNIPNGAMENFVYVTTQNLDHYLKEKQSYIDLLKQRSEVFLTEAKACQLDCYPYKEGFFITLAIPDNAKRDRFHQALIDHQIYTIKVNHGIRVGICSLSLKKCPGLAKRMKDILDTI